MSDESITAAIWNPDLHPRGADGKFIELGAIVEFVNDFDGKKMRGVVTGNNDRGKLRVSFKSKLGNKDSESTWVSPESIKTIAAPKGRLPGNVTNPGGDSEHVWAKERGSQYKRGSYKLKKIAPRDKYDPRYRDMRREEKKETPRDYRFLLRGASAATSDDLVDLYLDWEEALNGPEVDVALVASLESVAESIGFDLWQINNRMLNSMTAANWNPLLHPRGWGGRFIEVGDLVGFFRGGKEERGTVRAIKPDGKLVVEMDRRGGDGINVRAMTVDPRDVRPLGAKGFLRGGREGDRPFSNLSDVELQQTYANTVDTAISDVDPQLVESLGLDAEYLREEMASRGLARGGAEDRPFSNLSDSELQQAYQNTVNRLIQDVDDQPLMDSLELDVEYFREEFERRGIPRVGIGSRYQESGDQPFASLSDVELQQTYQNMVDAMIGDIDPQLLESLELDRDYILEELARRGIPRIASSGDETSLPTDFPEDFPPDTLVDFRTKGINARGYVVGAEDSDLGEDTLLFIKSGNEVIPRRVRNVSPVLPDVSEEDDFSFAQWIQDIRAGREEAPNREGFLDRLARYYGEAPIPDFLMRWYENLMRTATPKHLRGPRLYPQRADGMVAVAGVFDPDLHPRGRDGKFIESFGLVRLFDFSDQRGERHSEGVGTVTDITPDRNNPGNPTIEVELPDGGHAFVKPNQVASAPQIKARLGDDGEGRRPSLEEAEDLLDREIAERLMAEKPEADVLGDEAEELAYVETIYNTSRDVGNLMVGDEIILPGDIPGTIVEFEFPGDRPDSVRVHTDGGTYHGRTTDILPNYRPGEEVNPIGEPVMEKPGELGSKNNPIKTSDPLEAVKALRDGKHVELESVDQVSTLLEELAAIANEAKAKGEDAGDYDLCLVSVPGTNLFCAESKGVPRIEMPQLSGFPVPGSKADSLERTEEGGVDIGPAFMDHLRGKGVGVSEERRLASHLKASQSELIGPKIAGMMKAMDSGNEFAIRNIRENPIFVTSDGYVIDGHHRWAAVLGWDSLEGGLDDYDMPVRVIDMDIMEVLSEANKFANDFGIPQVSAQDVGPEIKQVNPPNGSKVDRPFEGLTDDELQANYAETVDRMVGDVDPQLLESLELDVEYFREELETRGLPRQSAKTETESFRERNVDLDLEALRRRAYGDAAISAEHTRAAEMSRIT